MLRLALNTPKNSPTRSDGRTKGPEVDESEGSASPKPSQATAPAGAGPVRPSGSRIRARDAIARPTRCESCARACGCAPVDSDSAPPPLKRGPGRPKGSKLERRKEVRSRKEELTNNEI
ncbi:unnamed protein product [Caenorhabditis nigoni]